MRTVEPPMRSRFPKAIDEELGIPVVYVLNKCLNQFPQVEAFEAEHQDKIVGKIP